MSDRNSRRNYPVFVRCGLMIACETFKIAFDGILITGVNSLGMIFVFRDLPIYVFTSDHAETC